MTILGYNIVSPERALVWADDVLYGPDGEPIRRSNKLAVNPLACSVLTGTGWIGVFHEASAVLMRVTSLDEAAEKLPATLRRASAGISEIDERARAVIGWQTYCLVGFSHRSRCIIGTVFDSRNEFRADRWSTFLSPFVYGETGTCEAHSVLCAAQAQVAWHQSLEPHAAAGTLALAEVTPSGISCRPLADLARGEFLSRPPAPSDQVERESEQKAAA